MATASRSFVPADSEAIASHARAREPRAQAFLLRLTRAVQRAAIYPIGHPAVAQGVGPLLDSLRALVADGALTIAVGRTRLLVSGGGSPPTEHELPWLAARLFDRQIAALTIEPQLDASALAQLVAWVSSTNADADALPELAGIALSRFDGRHLRFRERDAAAAADAPAEAAIAWHVLTAPLREAYGAGGGADADAPAALSARIRQALHAAEGTGVADLADRLVRVHEGAAPLDADAKAAVIVRLAALVNGLSPELRGSLLATRSADDTGKLGLVEDLLPHVPPAALADIAASVTIDATPVPAPFVRFLKKLSHLSADHPIARDALAARVAAPQAPMIVHTEAGERDAVAAVLAAPAIDPSAMVPTKYGARLEQLASEPHERPVSPRLDVTCVESPVLDAHAARIALLQARKYLPSPDAEPYVRCVIDVLPRERARRAMPTLMGAADLVIRLRAVSRDLSPEGRELLARCERAFAEPDSTALAIDAIVTAPADAGDLSPALLLAGGAGAARAAVDWLASAPEGEPRLRVAAVVALFESDVFRSVVAPALSSHRAAADALVAVLDRIDPARAIDLAVSLTSQPRAEIRSRATTWLLGASLGVARLQRVLQQALEDREPIVVTAALDAAARLDHRALVDPLVSFATARVPPILAPLQARAIAMIVARDEGAARLASALARRGYLCGTADRRVSVTIASALERAAPASARKAARAWRWTPAGLLSVFSRPIEAARS